MNLFPTNDAPPDRRRRAAMLTLHMARLLEAEVQHVLERDLGLLLSDTRTLAVLQHGPLRMSEIASRLALTAGGTTKVVNRLEDLDYVRRDADPADGRATVVELTADGERAGAEVEGIIDGVLEHTWVDQLSAADVEDLVRVLGGVLDTDASTTQ